MTIVVYIEKPSILLSLDNELNIMDTWRVRRSERFASHVTRVSTLRATAHQRPKITADYFETDGMGCFSLVFWITNERPDASPQTHLNRFERLFSNNPTDALTAALRIYGGREGDAAGETAYFISKQWAHHPAEMAAIKIFGSMR